MNRRAEGAKAAAETSTRQANELQNKLKSKISRLHTLIDEVRVTS
jgi:hypothetical protein